ncbi:MAG: hypothetical protein WKI04_07040 [Ferruginibacter sp.]
MNTPVGISNKVFKYDHYKKRAGFRLFRLQFRRYTNGLVSPGYMFFTFEQYAKDRGGSFISFSISYP